MRTHLHRLLSTHSLRLALIGATLGGAPVLATEPTSLQIGKAEQRWIGIRTQTVAQSQAPLRLAGRVVVDPRRLERIRAGEAGRIEATDRGFIAPGSRVERDSVLAWLRPALPEPQRRDLEAQLAQARRDVALGRLQIERFSIDESRAFEGHLVTPSIRITSEYRAALARQAQLERTLSERIAIRAPTSGIVLRNNVQSGRVVRNGDVLFELDGGARLAVEAPIDTAARRQVSVATSTLTAPFALALSYLGDRFDASSRQWLALFSIEDDAPALQAGQPVRVHIAAETRAPLQLPAHSVFLRDGRHWIWVHDSAERFSASAVTPVGRASTHTLIVEAELSADQRIVIAGSDALSLRLGTATEPRS